MCFLCHVRENRIVTKMNALFQVTQLLSLAKVHFSQIAKLWTYTEHIPLKKRKENKTGP